MDLGARQGDDAGIVRRVMFGNFIDVTERKQAEEGRELLAGEMSHRVKNLLAIASGLTAITSSSTKTTSDMAPELTLRLTALGRAHDLVRPVPGKTEAASALIGDLLTVLLAPYDDLGAFSGRIRVSIPRMRVGDAATTVLALVVHELATNSVKYGALSVDTGTLDVSCSAHDEAVTLIWTESGGPKVKPALRGIYADQSITIGLKTAWLSFSKSRRIASRIDAQALDPQPGRATIKQTNEQIRGAVATTIQNLLQDAYLRNVKRKIGAGEGIRTLDPNLGKVVLYP